MKDPKPPTLDELLAEYRNLTPDPVQGKTTEEWQQTWGISGPRTKALLRHALANGRMRTVYTLRPDAFRPGRVVRVYLHSFVDQKKKSKS